MTLIERLQADAKDAMRAKDTLRLGALRMAIAAIQEAEIAKRPAALEEAEAVRVISKAVKARRDAASEFRKGGRTDLAEKEEREAALLEAYLPKGLSEEEVRSIVAEAVRATGAASARDLGRVMKEVMPRIAGRADGALVQRLVREALGA